MSAIQLVTTRTPLRISFAGGGTDLPEHYRRTPGAVLSTAIDKYLYVTVKTHSSLFGQNYRLNYSETEQVQTLDEIRNGVARECLRFLPVTAPLYISTISDLPGSSGLGSSSSFAVGLLNALHTMRGERVSAAQLAEEACHIEIEVLKKPIGKQDQYAAAFGGLNFIKFNSNGSVSIEHKHLPDQQIEKFFHSTLLFWTSMSRESGHILEEQQKNVEVRANELNQMGQLAEKLSREMETRMDPQSIGQILQEGWQLKRLLASKITSPEIDTWYESAIRAGAYGGKLCGAGGGGFLLFICHPSNQAKVRQALCTLNEVKVDYESTGSQVVYQERLA